MDPMSEEQLDYEDEDYASGRGQKLQYPGGGAISALAEDELLGEDDDYDDLYNDVNVGEGFMNSIQQHHPPNPNPSHSKLHPMPNGLQPPPAPLVDPSSSAVGSSGFRPSEPPGGGVNIPGVGFHDGKGSNTGIGGVGGFSSVNNNYAAPKARASEIPLDPLAGNLEHRGSIPQGKPMGAGVKEIKFFDERASGKSKGYCQVEFYDAAAAAACKEGMNSHVYNGRPCVVVFATQQNLRQMGAAYLNKTQAQAQGQQQGRRVGANNNDGNRNGGWNYQGGNGDNRNYGRNMGSGRGGQGMQNRGQGGNYMQNRGKGNMGGGGAGGGGGGTGVGKGMMAGAFGGPAVGGPPAALMHPQGLMGPGFDPTYGSHMGRGGIYGGFPAPGFPGMMPTFPAVNNAVALPGVAPHVNPAFFGRGMAANGMGMMGAPGMDGHPAGMWTDPSMGGWTPEEHGRTRESSYGDDGASDHAYGESQDRGGRSGNTSRDKERGGSECDSDRRHRDDKEADWDRHRYRDDKEGYSDHRHRERDWDYGEDWDKGRSSSSRSRSKTRMSQEEEKRSHGHREREWDNEEVWEGGRSSSTRSRSKTRMSQEDEKGSRPKDVDYVKRRRLPSE
ncbi:hypothetical protein EJ110_NYTH39959 [Nymphaea thermarum]|nr:hypothetical protein EJ110_NYTH39959 [Nymphaea thermarum]